MPKIITPKPDLSHITPLDLIIGMVYREMRRRKLEDVQPNDNGNEIAGFRV